MKRFKGFLSLFVLTCIALMCLMSTSIFAADSAIQAGAGSITGYSDTSSYDYIYYGTWNNSPIMWRVLDGETNTGATGLFILSEYLLQDGLQFSSDSNAWQGSDAQAWRMDFAGISGNSVTDAFTSVELNATLATTKSDDSYSMFSASDNILNGDKAFFLSAEEGYNANYGFTDMTARIAYLEGNAKNYWLRSPCDTDAVGVTDAVGGLRSVGFADYFSVTYYALAVRPAFNLDTSKVIFTSAANNSGHNSSFSAPVNYSGSEWKLTLADSNSFATNASINSTDVLCGETLTISHTKLSSLSTSYTNVTAVLTDSSGNLIYYGSINSDKSATNSTVTIPTDLTSGIYTLSIYGEDWNSAYSTDYATGTPFTTTIKVTDHTPMSFS